MEKGHTAPRQRPTSLQGAPGTARRNGDRDTRDFGIRRRLTHDNWNALRVVGEHANQRLCDAEAADATPAPDVATLNQVTRPSVTSDGQHSSALRFGDARAMAFMAATTAFCHLITGFDNRALTGRAVAVLFTKTYGRVLSPGPTALDPRLPAELAKRSPLALAWKNLNTELDTFIDHGLAAA